MIRRCEECEVVYDDVDRWTLCPHGPLSGGNKTYCRIHDLDPCPFCDPAATNPLVKGSNEP